MSGIVNHYLPLIQGSRSTAQRFSSSIVNLHNISLKSIIALVGERERSTQEPDEPKTRRGARDHLPFAFAALKWSSAWQIFSSTSISRNHLFNDTAHSKRIATTASTAPTPPASTLAISEPVPYLKLRLGISPAIRFTVCAYMKVPHAQKRPTSINPCFCLPFDGYPGPEADLLAILKAK